MPGIPLLAGLILLVAACNEEPGPEGADLDIVSGAGVTDTIGSGDIHLVVRLTRADEPLAGETVVFTSVGTAPVELGLGTRNTVPVETTTDSDGLAQVWVWFGTRAGEAVVRANAPDQDVSVDAEYTVLAGAAAGARILPADTALRVGGSFDVEARAVDRGGNPATGSVSVEVATPGILDLEGQETVQGLTFGRGIVIARFGESATDTAYVSVVPDYRLVAVASSAAQSGSLVTFELDGRNARTLLLLPNTSDGVVHPDWNPETHWVAYEMPHGSGRSIRAVDVNAERGALIDPETFEVASWPQYSADGDWLFFAGRETVSQPLRVWRAAAEGGAPTPVSPIDVALDFPENFSAPSPSPSGDSVAFAADDSVRVLVLATGTQTAVARGEAPRWAPDGSRIAFHDDDGIWLVDPDGDGRTHLAVGQWAIGELDWSNDGEWLVARWLDRGVLAAIEVATGEVLPLGYTTGWSQPAFAPELP